MEAVYQDRQRFGAAGHAQDQTLSREDMARRYTHRDVSSHKGTQNVQQACC